MTRTIDAQRDHEAGGARSPSLLNALACLAATAVCGCTGQEGVTGHACIVLDLRNPGLCGAMQLVDGLTVVELESGRQTTTDLDGNFSIPLADGATSAVLRVAEDRPDRRTTLVGVPDATAGDVLTPIITTILWDTYMDAIRAPAEDPSRAIIHISFPGPGPYLGGAQIPGATQILYNQGEAFVWAATPPGDQTIAIMAFGVPADTGTAMLDVVSRTDKVLFSAPVPVQAGAITWVHIDP